MALHEIYGERDLSYSAWHRPQSIGRYLSDFDSDKHRVRLISSQSYIEYSDPYKNSVPAKLGMIDIDGVVIDGKHWSDRGPVALIEAALTQANPNKYGFKKPATILSQLGRLAQIPTYVVLYMLADSMNPAAPGFRDIQEFFVQQWYPAKQNRYRAMSPKQYAEWLVLLRQERGNHLQPSLWQTLPLYDEVDISRMHLYGKVLL